MAETSVLVVYYSRTGTTEAVADAIADATGADVERIREQKSRSGILGFVRGGWDAMRRKTAEIGQAEKSPADYDLLVVGTPVWASTMTPAVRAYLEAQRESLPDVAFFLTTGGTGIENTFEQMRELCGRTPVATLGLKARDVKKGQYADAVAEFVAKLRPR